MQNNIDFSCVYCGETNTTFIDLSAGSQPCYVEDCQICCQPNVLYIYINFLFYSTYLLPQLFDSP